MNAFTRVIVFILGCVFTENIVFARLLGVYETLEKSDKVCTSALLGLVTAVVTMVSALCAWLVCNLLLVPLHQEFLALLVDVVIAALVVWGAGLIVQKFLPAVNEALGDSLPKLALNCAVVGLTLISVEASASVGEAAMRGCFGGLGFLLAMVLMVGVKERIEFSDVPESFKGLPITLISAGLIALAFMGFMGIA